MFVIAEFGEHISVTLLFCHDIQWVEPIELVILCSLSFHCEFNISLQKSGREKKYAMKKTGKRSYESISQTYNYTQEVKTLQFFCCCCCLKNAKTWSLDNLGVCAKNSFSSKHHDCLSYLISSFFRLILAVSLWYFLKNIFVAVCVFLTGSLKTTKMIKREFFSFWNITLDKRYDFSFCTVATMK